MAVNVSSLTAGIGVLDPQSTASVTPTSGAVLYLWVSYSVMAGGWHANDSFTVTGLGATWTLLGTGTGQWGSRRGSFLYRGVGASGSGSISLDFNSGSGVGLQEVGWSLVEATGLDGAGSDEGIAYTSLGAGSGTSITPSTSAVPEAGDATLSFVAIENNSDASVEAGWAALNQTTTGLLGVRRVEGAWDDAADTSCGWSWSTSSACAAAILVLKAAAAGGSHDLVVQDAIHAHSAENVTLTQVHELVVAGAGHAASADNLLLTQVHELAVSHGLHAHTADSPALTQVHELAVNDSTHAHTADSPALTQVHELEVDGAAHGHSADNVTVTTSTTLDVHDSTHAHSADGIALTQVHVLEVAEAIVAHAADTLALTQVHELGVADATHAHTADNLGSLIPSEERDVRWRVVAPTGSWVAAAPWGAWSAGSPVGAWTVDPPTA